MFFETCFLFFNLKTIFKYKFQKNMANQALLFPKTKNKKNMFDNEKI